MPTRRDVRRIIRVPLPLSSFLSEQLLSSSSHVRRDLSPLIFQRPPGDDVGSFPPPP